MKKWLKQPVGSGALLIAASFAANFLNFAFNAFLGRYLTFAEFGFVNLINTFSYLLSIPLSALAATVTHKIAFLFAKGEADKEKNFYQQTNQRLFNMAVVVSILWLCSASLIAKFFQVSNIWAIVLFTPALFISIVTGANGGFLRGRLLFAVMAVTILIETSLKLLAAVFLVFIKEKQFVYATIPFSMVVTAFVGIYFVRRALKNMPSPASKKTEPYRFPRRFFSAALISTLSTTLFFTLDVILAKHYLHPIQAGQYALLSLIGKMIYFFGAMPNMFTLTLISREEGLNRNPARLFHKIFFTTLLMVLISIVGLGICGNFTIPLLFGKKTLIILPFVLPYIIGIALITLASTLAQYHLARKNLIFSYASLLVTFFMSLIIFLDHKSLGSFTNAIYLAGIFNFVFFVLIHFFQKNGIYVLRNLVDFVDVFTPNGNGVHGEIKGKKILIFNWRDTRHVWAGGAETYIHELSKRWVKMGHQVTIFCGNDSKCPRNEVIDGVRIKRRGGFYTVYVWAFLYYLLKFRGKYDIIIDSQNGMPFFTPLYVKEKTYSLLFHVHQEVFRKSFHFPLSQIARFTEKNLMPFWFRHVPFITISKSSENEIKKIYPQAEISIVNPGVNLAQLMPGEKAQTPLVLYLGRLKHYKSIDVLIRAFKQVMEKIPAARLTIAGEGEENPRLQHLVQKLELSGTIAFVGKVNEKEKIKLMQRAWVFVNPSMMEGWGITTIEANACGTAVVASDVPGLRDSVQDKKSGFLVPHGNTKELSAKIILILESEKLREEMSLAAISWAKQFDWQESAKSTLKIICR